MTKVTVDLSEDDQRIVNAVRFLFDINSKSKAINKLIKLLEPQVEQLKHNCLFASDILKEPKT